LDGKDKVRRAELIQLLQAKEYEEKEVEFILKKRHSFGVLKCTFGKYSEAYVT
jgi:hypothetical protein